MQKENLVFVAGMSRAGTTFIYHNLQLHPQVFVANRKELGYFSYNFDEGLEWFERFFADQKPDQVAFDICGVYFMDKKSIARIKAFNPDARVILGIRHPVEWVQSMYTQYKAKFPLPPFQSFVEECTVRREGKNSVLTFEENKIQDTVAQFQDAFGENLLLFDFRMLKDDALGLLREIERFSGLPEFFKEGNFTNSKINARGRKQSVLFGKLFMLPGVATFVSRIVPRSILGRVRRFVEKKVSKKLENSNTKSPDTDISDEDIAFLTKRFASDEAFVTELFQDGPIVCAGSNRHP